MFRTTSVLLTTAAASLLAAASAAADPAPTVTLSVNSPYAVVGGTVTAKVTSSVAGTITLAQERANHSSGPGRCFDSSQFSLDYTRLRGPARVTINDTTPGQPVTVKIAATALGYGAGNLLDFTPDTPANADHCFDPFTQFNKLGAIVTTPSYDQGEGVAALTRIL